VQGGRLLAGEAYEERNRNAEFKAAWDEAKRVAVELMEDEAQRRTNLRTLLTSDRPAYPSPRRHPHRRREHAMSGKFVSVQIRGTIVPATVASLRKGALPKSIVLHASCLRTPGVASKPRRRATVHLFG